MQDTHSDVPIVIISGHGNVETAVSAIKNGAYDYIEKPFKADRLILVVARRALEALAPQTRQCRIARTNSRHGDPILSANPRSMRQLRQALEAGRSIQRPCHDHRTARCRQGTGCPHTACMVQSDHDGPFIILPAATMSPERVEEELFGVESAADGAHCSVSAHLNRHMAARCILTKYPTCRCRPRGKSCGCWSIRKFQRVNGSTRGQG